MKRVGVVVWDGLLELGKLTGIIGKDGNLKVNIFSLVGSFLYEKIRRR